jgi:FkbM family methyltransferase
MGAVTCVFNQADDAEPIRSLLKELGYKRVVTFPEFRELFELRPHFWLGPRKQLNDHEAEIRVAWKLMADERSRGIFVDSLRFRLAMDTRVLRKVDWDDRYLPGDLPRLPMPLRLIDGGAFDGDSLEFLVAQGAAFEAVAAFEPDPGNFRRLRETMRKLGGRLGERTLWPCGLSDETVVAAFSEGKEQASAVSPEGNVHVQLVALDDVLPSFRPNYIKLDIEGSELAALKGGARMIRECQPAIAVCVYHRPEDLWEIPIFLHEMLPSHRIGLRTHKFQGFDMVAYALPAGAGV